jgi:hypothetical protein
VVVGGLEGSTTPSMTPIVKPTKREAGLIDVTGRAFPSMSPSTDPPSVEKTFFPKPANWKYGFGNQNSQDNCASYLWPLMPGY